MSTFELDPAYFDQDEWEYQELGGNGVYSECYVHEETGKRVTPERFHEYVHNAKVVENADVISRRKLRNLATELSEIADEDQNEYHIQTNFEIGLKRGVKRCTNKLLELVDVPAFDSEEDND